MHIELICKYQKKQKTHTQRHLFKKLQAGCKANKQLRYTTVPDMCEESLGRIYRSLGDPRNDF